MGVTRTEDWERLTELVEAARRKHGVPGAAVGLLRDGEATAAGFGVTSVDHPLDVTAETLFQIGSITKTFTGTILMRLADAGEIDLDSAVRAYVPSFRVADEDVSARATLRHLLTHVGGWAGDLFVDSGEGADALARYVERMAELKQVAPLGEVWSYNNAGFAVAGLVIERVTGTDYATALREKLLAPLGLEQCRLDAAETIAERFAVGHTVGSDGAKVARPWALPRAVLPMGGIMASAGDLLTYAGFHLGDGSSPDGSRILARETLALMHAPAVTVRGVDAWGLPFSIDDTHGVRLVSHGGGTVGQASLLAMVPEKALAFVVLTNADRGNALIADVTRWVFRELLGIEIEDPKPIDSTEDELARLVGRYERPFVDLELGLLHGRLVGQLAYKKSFPTEDAPPIPMPPPMALARCDDDRLIVLDGPTKDQTLDVIARGGAIEWLRFGGRVLRRRA